MKSLAKDETIENKGGNRVTTYSYLTFTTWMAKGDNALLLSVL